MIDSQTKKNDISLDTLSVIKKAENFNKWMYQTIKPYCDGQILEIGSGIGNISQLFLRDGYQMTLSDIRSDYCENLRTQFSAFSNFKGIIHLDIVHRNFEKEYQSYFSKYDTVFALNVIEHIPDDNLAIRNCQSLLKSVGKLIILAPAYPQLFNNFDQGLEHYRRYTKKSLNLLISKNNFSIIKSQYFNAVGILGWYISGKLQGNTSIPKDQMKLYDNLMPVVRIIDVSLLNKVGLSVITIAQNNES
jgi:2-polyprenyl-3-methyl-5-hydroxy-6-metoxy-1,4-benzoquinol methylase